MAFCTFSCISCVDWASQKATVARSLRMGISTVQSRPSSSATRGRGCIGPFIIWGRIPAERHTERDEERELIIYVWHTQSSELHEKQ